MINSLFNSRNYLLTLTLILTLGAASSARAKEISIMQYNVENLFDPNNPPPNYDEFTPDGAKHWTVEKLKAKLVNLGKVVTSIKNKDGSVCPDILALSEVHNANVLKLWKSGPIKACGYTNTIIDPTDPDPRGIRTAMLTRLELAGKPFSHKTYPSGRFMIEVALKVNEHPLVVFTNHWKSRLQRNPNDDGGAEKRSIAAKVLKNRVAQLEQQNPELDIVAVGDLNDEFENDSIRKSLGTTSKPQQLVDDTENKFSMWESSFDLLNQNIFATLEPESISKAFRLMRSTFYYEREKAYNQFDHILLSKALFDDQGFTFVPKSFEVIRYPDFTDPRKHSPIPFADISDSSPQAAIEHGASDHFPVVLRLNVAD